MLVPWKESYEKHRQRIKKLGCHLADKGLYSQAVVFPVVMYKRESWTVKKAEHWRVMLSNCDAGEDSWESLGLQDQTCQNKANQPWIFIGRTVAEAEAPILWPPDAKSWLTEKEPDVGKDARKKKKKIMEDERDREHHRLNGHELSKLWKTVKDRKAGRAAVPRVAESDTT